VFSPASTWATALKFRVGSLHDTVDRPPASFVTKQTILHHNPSRTVESTSPLAHTISHPAAASRHTAVPFMPPFSIDPLGFTLSTTDSS
jgi:hypothetical protein